MKKRTLDSEYVSSFCLEMALLLHAGRRDGFPNMWRI